MTGAFAYLIATSARNRVRARVARLRNPRYAVALLLGATYLWLVYLRPSRHQPQAGDIVGSAATTLLPLLMLGYVVWTWLFGSDRNALAFSPAEVTLLFSAPVSRRALVLYRISRTQLTILTTSIVWTVVFRQAPTWAAGVTHVLSYWLLLSTLNLNRLGVAILRADGAAHGMRGARRHWIAIVAVVAVVGVTLAPVVAALPGIRAAQGAAAMADAVADALTTSPAHWALLPFRVLLAPLSAAPGTAWLTAMGPALLIFLAMGMWVLHTDAAFEEAAAEASARQARRLDALRERRGTAVATLRAPTRTLPLAPTGIPAVALLWKNAMWLLRANQLRGLLGPPLIALLCALTVGVRSEDAAFVIAVACGVLALTTLIIGPMTMRNDLRSELLHLSLLKTLPLRGRDVVFAEVLSSALPMALSQYLLALVAALSLRHAGVSGVTAGVGLALVTGAPVLLMGLNVAVFLVHNGLALLFPGWVRLGSGTSGGGGVEGLGLGMISVAFSLLMLGVLLIVPGLAMAAVTAALRARLALGLTLGAVLAGVLLLTEGLLGAWALGGTLDRVEPMAVEG